MRNYFVYYRKRGIKRWVTKRICCYKSKKGDFKNEKN